ncbi:MAG: hypothetical protein GY714_12025 [Desulfobacterales bacterium]|nr:hypothetical protein [Desulfobacterales bacterium]MCP4160019.1 hypothetical protein [Deltaproteobacteria bacterium]
MIKNYLKILVILFILSLMFGLEVIFAGEQKVLIIHSYSRKARFEWVNDMSNGVKKILKEPYYRFYEFEMHTKLIPQSDFEKKADEALAYCKTVNPDIVIISDDNGLNLMVPRIGKKTPIVFMGINANIRLSYPWLLEYRNVTGILERPLIKLTIIKMAKLVTLDVRKALILLGDSPTARAFFQNDLLGKTEFKILNIQANVKMTGNFTEWKKHIRESKQKKYDILLVAGNLAMRGKGGRYIKPEKIAEWISKNSPIPAFTVHENQIGKNQLIGGMVISGKVMGEDAAKLVKIIIEKNRKPGTILYKTQKKGRLIFCKSQLARWNLKVIPNNSFKVIFKE